MTLKRLPAILKNCFIVFIAILCVTQFFVIYFFEAFWNFAPYGIFTEFWQPHILIIQETLLFFNIAYLLLIPLLLVFCIDRYLGRPLLRRLVMALLAVGTVATYALSFSLLLY